MAKKQNYQRFSNIEVYLALGNVGDLNFCNVKDSQVAKDINEVVDLALSKGLKRPWLRFMRPTGDALNHIIFYPDSKKDNHVGGMQTLDSIKTYLSNL